MRAALLALALLGSAADAAAESSSNLDIAAFESVCIAGGPSLDGVVERARANGWTAVEGDAHPMLPPAFELSKSLVPLGAPMYFAGPSQLHTAYLIVGTGDGGLSRAVACYLFDFEATGNPDEAVLTSVLGSAPDQRETHGEGALYMARWNMPGLPTSVVAAGSSFITPDGPVAAELGLSGSMLALLSAQ